VSDDWHLGPFTPRGGAVLATLPNARFACPVRGEEVRWAAKDVFNPGGVVRDGKIHLLVRAEDVVGRYAGTSRIGLATSADGTTFELEPEPVIFPANDAWQAWEWPGGCEDPRVVESPEGGFICLYTAFRRQNRHAFRRHL
jgi:beta-1,2-mannosidase